MRTFRDNQGREWALAITVDAIKRVRSLLNVDLLQILAGQLIDRLQTDPVLLCDVVYAVCKPEADARGIADEDFGRAMAGDAIAHATNALLAELVDFSPRPGDRANLRRALEKTELTLGKAQEVIAARLDALDVDAILDQALARCGLSSGAVPASSASIPAP